jgi:AcrR family transcriptional regulator
VTKKSTRDRIVEAADRLFYERGYEHTSFTDISEAVGIARGNFYFHFKSKDDILNAVIQRRLSNVQSIIDNWDVESKTPEERIRRLIKNLVDTSAQIKRYGCPVGTLCSELAKLGHPSRGEANKLFTLFRTWLHKQFVLLGREQDADDLAVHVLVLSQGVSTLASAFRDEEILVREAVRIDDWLQECIENVPRRGPG